MPERVFLGEVKRGRARATAEGRDAGPRPPSQTTVEKAAAGALAVMLAYDTALLRMLSEDEDLLCPLLLSLPPHIYATEISDKRSSQDKKDEVGGAEDSLDESPTHSSAVGSVENIATGSAAEPLPNPTDPMPPVPRAGARAELRPILKGKSPANDTRFSA